MKSVTFMTPCTPRCPQPLQHFPLPLLQITTVCFSDPPMHYVHNLNTSTTLPIHHDKLLLSLRRHLRLLWGSSPFYHLCNATRQTWTLISYWTVLGTPPSLDPLFPLHGLPLGKHVSPALTFILHDNLSHTRYSARFLSSGP